MGVKYYIYDGKNSLSVEINEYDVLKSLIRNGNENKSELEINSMLGEYAIKEIDKSEDFLWNYRKNFNFFQGNMDWDDFNDLWVDGLVEIEIKDGVKYYKLSDKGKEAYKAYRKSS